MLDVVLLEQPPPQEFGFRSTWRRPLSNAEATRHYALCKIKTWEICFAAIAAWRQPFRCRAKAELLQASLIVDFPDEKHFSVETFYRFTRLHRQSTFHTTFNAEILTFNAEYSLFSVVNECNKHRITHHHFEFGKWQRTTRTRKRKCCQGHLFCFVVIRFWQSYGRGMGALRWWGQRSAKCFALAHRKKSW